MNQINSIRNTVSYYDRKKSIPAKQVLNSIPTATIYKHSGMNALSSYNQASVSFGGLGFFQKLSDKFKAKKEEAVTKHQQKKEERLQKKAEKIQAKLDKIETAESKKPQAPAAAADVKPAEAPKAEAPVTEPAKTEAPKAEEVKKAGETATAEGTPKAEKESTQEIEIIPFPYSSGIKCLIIRDKETGTVFYTRYNEEGSVKSVQAIEPDGTDTYTLFYDKEGEMPKESFIDLPDGKHRYIKYRKNGTVKVVAELKEDNKTLTSLSRYHYKEGSDKLDSIRTIYEDRSATREWFTEDGTLECTQFEKDGRVSQIDWYFEDGETPRLTHIPLDNGGLARFVCDKTGRLILSDVTKPDKRTSEEVTYYYYEGDSKKYSRTITTYDTNKKIETWYNDSEIATCSVYSEDGKKTKTKWFFEDGETTNIIEYYYADGHKEKLTMDKVGRWLDSVDFAQDGSVIKTTKYFYEGDSEEHHSSISTYTDGKVEKIWYDQEGNKTCRRTEENNAVTKIEWFYEDGKTPKVIRTYKADGTFTEQAFDKEGNPVESEPIQE